MLTVEQLTVSAGDAVLLDGVSLSVGEGEVLALVGESGSGKTLTAMSVVRLLPRSLVVNAHTLSLDGVDLLTASERTMNTVRGGRVGVLFQHPKRMLDPTASVGAQVAEPLRRFLGMSRRAARDAAVDLLRDVGVPEPASRARAYAHQLSGGTAQRVMLAAALAGQPRLLVADEPTTALDATVAAQILRLVAAKKAALGMSVLWISHDLGAVASVADRVAVLHRGRIVESGPVEKVLEAPEHPHTRGLVACSLLRQNDSGELHTMEPA